MRILHIGIALAVATACFADTVTLKNGRSVHGTYLGGNARQVRVEVGDSIQTLNVSDISRIDFGGGAPVSANPVSPDEDRPTLRRTDSNVLRPSPSPPQPTAPSRGLVELPAGTNLVVRMIDGVDSEVAQMGQSFQGSLDEPVMVSGEAVIPRGSDVVLKLVDAKESGKLTGRAELTLDLVSIRVNGRMVDVNTQTVSRESDSRGATTAKRAAGVGAVGAIIGAIAGGGKGAAIGAAAGGAAGAGTGIITKGERVKIPSETRLTFVLDTAVRL
jgi:hypothetical protein